MRYLRLIKYFMLSSAQTDLAYRANFAIGLLSSILNLIVGVLGLIVLFSQVNTLNGCVSAAVTKRVNTGINCLVVGIQGFNLTRYF